MILHSFPVDNNILTMCQQGIGKDIMSANTCGANQIR